MGKTAWAHDQFPDETRPSKGNKRHCVRTPQGETVAPEVFQQKVISIEPTKSDTIYAPQYSPEAAYSAPP
ncbi:MAG: hypothetical protein ACREX3_06100, partial [Gammaproteobacteria bacterium]